MESENIKRTFEFAKKNDKPVVHLKAIHIPCRHSSILEHANAKQFEGQLKDLVFCEDIPVMLLTNIAPQFGLFNGSTCYFRGLLYLPHDADINVTREDFNNMKFVGMVLQEPFDLKPRGFCSYTRFHQLPMGAILLHVNGTSVSSLADVQRAINGQSTFNCRFQLPNTPPALPDFIVLKCNQYAERGGPNILRFQVAENLVPIPCTKVAREAPPKRTTNDKERTINGYRIGFKLEGAIVKTPFKTQGEDLKRNISEIKEQAHVPGLFNVAVSRCKHGKHNYIPDGEWPNSMDIQSQRLNPFVLEAEIFERAIQIKASQTLRKWTAEKHL